jgi:hypothetical protein
MARLTTDQFRTLFALGSGPSRCVGGNSSHASLLRRGWVSIRWVSRREYILSRTASGEAALAEELARKASQKTDLHT